jgi:hypothetical protein
MWISLDLVFCSSERRSRLLFQLCVKVVVMFGDDLYLCQDSRFLNCYYILRIGICGLMAQLSHQGPGFN